MSENTIFSETGRYSERMENYFNTGKGRLLQQIPVLILYVLGG